MPATRTTPLLLALAVAPALLLLESRRRRRLEEASGNRGVVPVRWTAELWAWNCFLWPVCVVADALGLDLLITMPTSIERLQREAERRTGLSDWGRTANFPGLYEFVVDRVNDLKLRVSPLGRLIHLDYLLRRLMRRLEVVDDAKKKAAKARDEPLQLTFITGLPRTGTTLLHRLLSLDPEARYPKTYELLDPLSTDDVETRVERVDKALNFVKRLVPQVDAIHEMGAREPEECLIALSLEMPMLFGHIMRICVTPTGDVSIPDLRDAYLLYEHQLRCLDDDDSEKKKRWVLKSPAHLAFIDSLVAAFPSANIVWTHRDPAQSVPSACSMFRTFAELTQHSTVDLHAIGAEQLAYWAAAVTKAETDLAAHPNTAHVDYDELYRDPVAAVAKLYEVFHWGPISPAFHARMTAYLDKNKAERAAIPAHIRKLHRYSLEDYGLSTPTIRDAFASYYTTHLPQHPSS